MLLMKCRRVRGVVLREHKRYMKLWIFIKKLWKVDYEDYIYKRRVVVWYYLHKWNAVDMMMMNAKNYLALKLDRDNQPEELVQ